MVQRAQSGDLVVSVVAGGYPAAFLKKLQQRNPRRKSFSRGIRHGVQASMVRMRAAAQKSQARMVGEKKKRRLALRRQNHRLTVEGSAMRSGSRQTGADSSSVLPSASRPRASLRAGRL